MWERLVAHITWLTVCTLISIAANIEALHDNCTGNQAPDIIRKWSDDIVQGYQFCGFAATVANLKI